MANIGFIGLGHMGLPMAKNLLNAGHKVCGFDLQQQPLQELAKAGGQAASSCLDLARNQDCVITMLQTGQQVQAVCQGPEGILANIPKNCLYIDCSTIDVQSSRQIHELAQTKGIACADAPVSGGVAGANNASLTFMVGASIENFSKSSTILEAMGKNIIHTGSPGSGQAAKICNNMLLGISMIACSEALLLGEKLGIEPAKLHEVITKASGDCWVMDKYVPMPNILANVPANNNYQAGFSAAMMLKDLNLSQQCAEQVAMTTSLGALAQSIYAQAADNIAELDFSAILTELHS